MSHQNQINAADVSKGQCIVLICPHSSYRLGPYLKSAEDLGIHVLVVSQGEHSLVSAIASGIHVDFSDQDRAFKKIISAIESRNVIAVLGIDDMTVELAARLSVSQGLVHNDVRASVFTRRKDLARGVLKGSAVSIPEFSVVRLADLARNPVSPVAYPCVIKPVSLSGSRGVICVNDNNELAIACKTIQGILENETLSDEEKDTVLIEQYIPGYEFAFEGMLHKGELQCLALFDKPDLMQGPYFEETYYITPSRLSDDLQLKIKDTVLQACQVYGLKEGPIHAEVRIDKGEVWFMEMASRTIGGQCAQLLQYATGKSLEGMVIQNALGKKISIAENTQAAGVLMIPITERGLLRRVEGILEASKMQYIEDIEISISEGYELEPLPTGYSYLGFIFSRAPTPSLAEQALRNAHKKLKIITSPVLFCTQRQ
ncbi:MAG: ATP-grasp domain-containing protein [Gammaproteobacteria bacterium]|nr:ATP-grasp domain-containing protein [Gammaproteobacteria bacterium]